MLTPNVIRVTMILDSVLNRSFTILVVDIFIFSCRRLDFLTIRIFKRAWFPTANQNVRLTFESVNHTTARLRIGQGVYT